MKNQIIKTLFIAFVICGISQVTLATAFADETRSVSGFTAIASSGSFHVHVKIDGTESCKIVADADIIAKIETVVEKGTLKIRSKKGADWHSNKGVDIYVTAKEISSLVNSGSGDLKVEGTCGGSSFSVASSGSGSISASVKATTTSIAMSGSGNVNLQGSSEHVSIAISGSGSVEAKGLKTGNTSVNISGSGNVAINAEKELNSHIMGSGSVRYTGNATVSTSKMGSGSVTKQSY